MTAMTDPTAADASEPAAAPPPPDSPPDFGDRMKALGQEAQVRGEALGREAQAAGDRWVKDPAIVRAASTASRLWGLLLIAVGLWFFADVALGYSLPTVPWRDLWPALLVVLGLFVIGRAITRRA
jgi:hypothetical protein